jgi:putative tricarboxylic transport membrane protein
MLLSVPLVNLALKFGPSEYFSLMVLGMVILTFLVSASMTRALMMSAIGIILGTVGQDSMSGMDRFTFKIPELLDGVGLIPLVMGLFGISEVLVNIDLKVRSEILSGKVKGLLPTLKDWSRSIGAIIRGTFIGFFLGILPGGGGVISSFVSYAFEKRISSHPEEFGKGAIEGVAGPESANNASAQAAFIPLLSLGIPSNVVMAMLLGALIIHGVTPGPLLLTSHPQLFWGVVASMYVGNIMLLVLNLPLISIWVKLLMVPYSILFPLILLLCFIGAYSVNNSMFDVALMMGFGIIGYLMRKLSLEAAPLILAFVLGPMLETSLRLALIKSGGSFSIFFTRPISAIFLIISIILFLTSLLPKLSSKRPGAVLGGDDET